MIAKYFKNKKINSKFIETTETIRTKIKQERNLAINISAQKTVVDTKKYTFTINNKKFPCATKDNITPKGKFIVIEKWKYPYWKSKTKIFSPNKNNPIGKYLIILYDPRTKKKINQSIHTWPKKPFAETDFKQGDFGEGCVRLKKKDMKKVFRKIDLGATVIIK